MNVGLDPDKTKPNPYQVTKMTFPLGANGSQPPLTAICYPKEWTGQGGAADLDPGGSPLSPEIDLFPDTRVQTDHVTCPLSALFTAELLNTFCPTFRHEPQTDWITFNTSHNLHCGGLVVSPSTLSGVCMFSRGLYIYLFIF